MTDLGVFLLIFHLFVPYTFLIQIQLKNSIFFLIVSQMRAELERVRSEKERYAVELNDVSKAKEVSDYEKKGLKAELKDIKFRETRLLTDCTELEDENITLQKQVSVLRWVVVEMPTSPHDIQIWLSFPLGNLI